MSFGLAFMTIYFLRDNLRYTMRTALLFYGIYILLWIIFAEKPEPVLIVRFALISYCMALPLVVFKRHVITGYNLYFIVLVLNNLLPNIIIAISSLVYGLVTGNRDFWFDTRYMATVTQAVFVLLSAINFILIYFICKKIVPGLRTIEGWKKYLLFFAGPVVNYIVSSYKNVFELEYAYSPDGWILIAETVQILVGTVVIMLLYFSLLKTKRQEKGAMEVRLQEEREEYRKNFELQQYLRKLNHDIRNYCIAGNQELKDKIREYTETILEEMGEEND